MTIGVATVLTMIALGTGAEAAIEQQVRAAGMNLIVVTAGNYKAKTEDDGGGVVDHQARLSSQPSVVHLRLPSPMRSALPDSSRPSTRRRRPRRLPSRRRPDGEARSPDRAPAARRRRGRARRRGDADPGRCRRDSPAARRAVRLGGDSRERARVGRRSEMVHAAPWRRRRAAVDPPVVDLHRRPLLHRARAVASRAGGRARRLRRGEAVRRRQPGRPRDSAVEAAVPGGRRRRQRQLDGGAGRRRRSVRRGLRAVHHDPQAAEPVQAERHHDHRGVDRRGDARLEGRDRAAARRGTGSG